VLHVVWSGDPSGIISQLRAILHEAASTSRFRQRAFFIDGRGAWGDELVTEGLAERFGVRSGWGPIGLCRLARAFRRSHPAIVHFHVPAFGPLLVALAALPRSRFVWTQHDPGVLTGSRRFRLFYRVFRGRFAEFVVPAPEIRPALVSFGVPVERINVVPHGLSISLRAGGEEERPPTKIGTIARLHAEKSIDELLRIAAELRGRDVEVSVLIVGDGPDRPRLERCANELGLGGLVEFAGEQVDVEPWLDRMDVFLATSPVEISGIAVLEAMARGVPVVAFAARGGVVDTVSRGGELLADRDPAKAADVVARLFSSAAERERLRARGLETASAHSIGATVARLDDVYDRAMSS
jgi:glycosyltransferase involved in cell wall biosynthesis